VLPVQVLAAQLQSGVQVQFFVPGYEFLQLSSQVLPIQVLAAQLLSGVQLQVFVPLHVVDMLDLCKCFLYRYWLRNCSLVCKCNSLFLV